MRTRSNPFQLAALATALTLSSVARADLPANAGLLPLATGQFITPTFVAGAVQQYLNPGLAAYPDFVAGEAVKSQLSPDGRTLAILCAGQNSLIRPDGSTDTANSTQFIFLYDVAGANSARPVLTQVLKPTNAHVGLAFSPDSATLYAGGGNDDAVYVYAKSGTTWAQAAKIGLAHAGRGVGLGVAPNAGGLAVSADGRTLVVANNYNDSISVIDTATRTVRYEHDLRPYFANNEGTAGGIGGTFPFAVVMKGDGTAYVSSDRDREVVAVDVSSATAGRLIARIRLDGNALGMTLDATQSRLYVAQDNVDQVAVIETTGNTVVSRIDARAPAGILAGSTNTGVATYAVTLSRDGNTLYAVNAGANSIAVVPLTGAAANTVTGLIPTAYEPHDITFSADGAFMYIVNGKNATGPNPGHLSGSTASLTTITYPGGNAAARTAANASNQYQFQLERASLVSAPVPAASDLPALTAKVAENNRYSAAPVANDAAVMAFVRERIKHVVYIVKENRTFDQILGDLTNGAQRRPDAHAVRQAHHAQLPQSGEPLRDARQLHGSGRRQHGRLVVGAPGTRHEHRDDHAADQLRDRQSRPVVRVRGREPQRTGQLRDRRAARRGGGAGQHHGLQRRRRRRCRRRNATNLLAGAAQPRVERLAVRYREGLHLRRRPERGRHGAQLRLPRSTTSGSVGTIAAPISDPFTANVDPGRATRAGARRP